MTSDNDDPQKLTVVEENTTALPPKTEIVRDLVVSSSPDESSEPDDRGSPGIQDREAIVPTLPHQSDKEVVRRLIVPNRTDTPEESDDPRSPGVQDRDVVIPPPSPRDTEEAEVIREIIIPHTQAESRDEAADS